MELIMEQIMEQIMEPIMVPIMEPVMDHGIRFPVTVILFSFEVLNLIQYANNKHLLVVNDKTLVFDKEFGISCQYRFLKLGVWGKNFSLDLQ